MTVAPGAPDKRWQFYWLRFRGEGLPVMMPALARTQYFRWQRIYGFQAGAWFIGLIRGGPSLPWCAASPATASAPPQPPVAERPATLAAGAAEPEDEEAEASARRRALFRIYTDLRRDAQDSESYEQHRFVAEAYRAYLRSFLDADERAALDLQDEVAELTAEVNQWRRGIKRSEN